jgi:hypothetical protein
MRWYIAGTAVVTAISVAMLTPDLLRGGLAELAILVLVLVVPVGALAEVVAHRRAGRHETADVLTRWAFELALALALVVYFDSGRIEAAADDCAAAESP